MAEFYVGELIIYQNGNSLEVGKIKRLTSDGAFVWYHAGETAAKTPFENMRKISNGYVLKDTSLGSGCAAVSEQRCCMCPGAICPGIPGTPHPEPSPCRLTHPEDKE